MFCTNCGQQLPDGAKFCTSCGKQVQVSSGFDNFAKNVNDAVNSVEREIDNTVQGFNPNSSNGGQQPYSREILQTDRSLVAYILFTIITCGIYSYYFIYKMAHDVNIACEGDGEVTGGLVAFIVLSFLTCGIYSWVWYYKLGNRLANNAPRYGLYFAENGASVLLWCIIGSFACGVGPFIAMYILIKNTNAICMAYNVANGFHS